MEMTMRKTIIVLSLLVSTSAFAGRGSSTSAIKSAIRSNNADAIVSELERAEKLICAACVEPVMALLDHEDYTVREAAAWWFARRPALKAEIYDLSVARLYVADSTEARNAAENRLVIGRDVVEALDEQVERDVFEPWEERLDAASHGGAPVPPSRLGVAVGSQVAREYAPVGQVLRCEPAFRCDDERLE